MGLTLKGMTSKIPGEDPCHSAVLVRSLNHWFKVGAIWFLQAFPVRHRNLHTETSDSPRCIGVGTKNIFQSRTRQGSTSRWCDSRKAESSRRAGRKTFLSSATRGSWEGKRFFNEILCTCLQPISLGSFRFNKTAVHFANQFRRTVR